MLKLTYHAFINKKIFIFSLVLVVFSTKIHSDDLIEDSSLLGSNPDSFNAIFSGSTQREGDYRSIYLIGDITYMENEMKYYLMLTDTIIVITYYTTPLTEFDSRDYLDQTYKMHFEPVEVFEIEIEFTEQFSNQNLIEVIHPSLSGYVARGLLFFVTTDNGQKLFKIRVENISMNG